MFAEKNNCNSCTECVFYRDRCVLGVRRVWNLAACREFRPYCLNCTYPEFYCYTCNNRNRRASKPTSFVDQDIPIAPEVPYACVWS